MIKITHEFPNDFYQNGYAENHTDYDYCLIHRYLDTPSYAKYMRDAVKKGRTVYLDNGVYELGEAFNWDDYVKVIKELKPTYYILPDVFDASHENIDSQLEFYRKYDEEIFKEAGSLPIAIPHGVSISILLNALYTFDRFFKKETLIAIPFGSAAFANNGWTSKDGTKVPGDIGYFTPEQIPYTPVRQALNRKKFVASFVPNFKDRKFHLLGCKSICEFDNWDDNFIKDRIVSIDTSFPVAMSFEGLPLRGLHPHFKNDINVHYYKPTFLIDKNFNKTFNEFKKEGLTANLDSNIDIFRQHVITWHEKY